MKIIKLNITDVMISESIERCFFKHLKLLNLNWSQPGSNLNYIYLHLIIDKDIENYKKLKDIYVFTEI